MSKHSARGHKWRTLRAAILTQHPHCWRCGQPANTIDHIQPASRGGNLYDPANLRAACAHCNKSRGDGTRNPATYTRTDW